MAPNTSRGQPLIERPKRSRQIGTYLPTPPMDFALGQYDVMTQIGKDVEYRRNWDAVLKTINKIEKEVFEYYKEAPLQAIMMEAYDYKEDYSVADSAVDLYVDDPETFFEAVEDWAIPDTEKQWLKVKLQEMEEEYETIHFMYRAIEEGYISYLFLDYGDWDTIRARPDWRAGTAIYNSNLE